ncbi:MAG TPA: 1,4-dihydroxy-2-naphthoate octaprenyltransferase [Elusimicrobiales bacterium]|nr:1,4-dihydroxy-2-naphthoate octaprenyltransferase [Elusimicrobiales bacterium]
MKKWLIVLRAYSWPASLVPVVVGSAAAARFGRFSWADLALTLPAALLVHSGANLANTYFDYSNGVDKAQTADDRGLVDHLVSPALALRLAAGLLAAGAGIGLFLAAKNHIPALLWLGAAGIALAWFYTARPGYKYRALGDIGIFLAFGPLIGTGTALIQTGSFVPEALWASIPVGLLVTAILHANNMRDLDPDSAANFRTLAGALGLQASEKLYYALIFMPYLFAFTFGSPWPALCCALSAPLALKLRARAASGDFARLVPETAGLVAAYGLLLSAGLLLAA